MSGRKRLAYWNREVDQRGTTIEAARARSGQAQRSATRCAVAHDERSRFERLVVVSIVSSRIEATSQANRKNERLVGICPAVAIDSGVWFLSWIPG